MISDKIINYLFICNTAAGLNIVSIDTVRLNSIKLEQAQSILSIYKLCLSVRSFVCLYPINVKTAKPIGPKFCVGPHMTPGKVYGRFQKTTLKLNLIFIKNSLKIHELF